MTVKRYWTGESMAEPPAAGEPVKSARVVPQFTPVKELSVPLSAARTVRVLPIACNCRHPQCAYLQHIPLRRTGFSFAALMPEPNAGRYSAQLIWDRRQTADA